MAKTENYWCNFDSYSFGKLHGWLGLKFFLASFPLFTYIFPVTFARRLSWLSIAESRLSLNVIGERPLHLQTWLIKYLALSDSSELLMVWAGNTHTHLNKHRLRVNVQYSKKDSSKRKQGGITVQGFESLDSVNVHPLSSSFIDPIVLWWPVNHPPVLLIPPFLFQTHLWIKQFKSTGVSSWASKQTLLFPTNKYKNINIAILYIDIYLQLFQLFLFCYIWKHNIPHT